MWNVLQVLVLNSHFISGRLFGDTASLKVMKIFSHPQTRNQSQVVQNDKLSRENVETKIFVGGKGTFSLFFEKKIEKNLEKKFQNFFFY